MDIINTVNSSTARAPLRSVASAELLDLGKMTAGSTLQASVQSVVEVDAGLRKSLMAHFQAQKTQYENKPLAQVNPAQSHATTHLSATALEKIFTQEKLFALVLEIRSKYLVAFSSRPIPPHTNFAATVTADRQLQSDTGQNLIKSEDVTASTVKSAANIFTPSIQNANTQVLNQGLRQYLPAQAKLTGKRR